LLLLATMFAGFVSCGKDEEGGVEDTPIIDNQLVGKWKVYEAWSYYYEGGGNYKHKYKSEWAIGEIWEFNADGTWKITTTDGKVFQGDDWTLDKTDFNTYICPYEVGLYYLNGSFERYYICGSNYTAFENGTTSIWIQDRNMRQDNALPKVEDMFQYRATKIQ